MTEQATTKLERVIHSHLWQPNDILERYTKLLPGFVKTQQYEEAAKSQSAIAKARRDIKDWEYILNQYQQERQCLESLRAFAIAYRSHPLRNPDDKLEESLAAYDALFK